MRIVPGIQANVDDEVESMGYIMNSDIVLGDWANVVTDININGRQTRYNYIYFPMSGNLYHAEFYKPRFIKRITNFHQFYFGTLNHK